jgi:integrase
MRRRSARSPPNRSNVMASPTRPRGPCVTTGRCWIGTVKAVEISKRDVIRLLDAVAKTPDAGNTDGAASRKMTHRPNRVFELVRAIFRWAVGRDLLQVDPSWGLSPPIKREEEHEHNLSLDEVAQFWAALDRTPETRRSTRGLSRGERVVGESDVPLTRVTALALKLSLVTGQRIGEVAGIEIKAIDFSPLTPVWTVPEIAPRTKSPTGFRCHGWR